ncbi:MAG: HAMP domain-containing histidine kinase [Clostridiales bacterium]|nr:HAMP domain-containing histidine kinase [Clostridiales bacterium]
MFKSIFAKYFSVVSLIIVTSFAALGAMQMLFSTRYWVSDKQNLLEENARTVAQNAAEDTTQADDGSYLIRTNELAHLINILSDTIDAAVFLTDTDGRVLLSSTGSTAQIQGARLPDETVKRLAELKGREYFTVGTLGGLYAERQYTAGVPIVKDNRIIGYAFVSAPAEGLSFYLSNNLQMFFLSALGVLTLAFIALYVMTFRMVRPLRRMAAATRSFAVGDFSCRIPVRGRDEVAELASALNSMAVSLSSVEGMRRDFVANVSHELKTPMTTIAGFIDGILDGTIPEEKRTHYLKIVSDEVKRLSRLVKTMLDLSRIDSGKLKVTPVVFDLTEVIGTALLSFEQRIERKGVRITGLEECPRMEVTADYDLIGQVCYNLLDNAVKFTNEGGEVSIRIEYESAGERQTGRTTVAIRNTGAGIPAEEMPHVFERFYKSDKSRSLDKNGVGLGLYIVKTVIVLHHGEIVVRSVAGEYCEFAFWLPDAARPVDHSSADKPPRTTGGRRRKK